MAATSLTTKKIGAFDSQEDSVDVATDKILKRLAIFYCSLQPKKSVDDFLQEVFQPLCEATPGNPAAIDVTTYTKQSEPSIRAFMTLIVRSCAHCIEATVADEDGLQLRAWNQVASATYHLGKLEGLIMVEPAITHIVSSRAAAGGNKRVSKYEPLRALAKKLASQKVYANKNQAAIAIKGKIMAESQRLGVGLMELNVIKTISGWISGCEFGGK
jgi:hypothetical protein